MPVIRNDLFRLASLVCMSVLAVSLGGCNMMTAGSSNKRIDVASARGPVPSPMLGVGH